MILDLKGVFESAGYSRDISYELDMSDYEDLSGGFPFKEPVHVAATVRNRADVVGLHVKTESFYVTQCDRCCAPLREPLEIAFDNVLVKEAEGDGENGDLIVICDDRLLLDELVRSNIILNLPMKHLCSESCKGLCPVCGKNLNDGDCGCDRGTKASPFSILKDLQ